MYYCLRPAIQSDQRKIRALIRQVKINPLGLDWRRFMVAVSSTSELIGCGQVKTHRDGTHELASIAVSVEYRNEGIATAIVRQLINNYPKPLYLTCRAGLESFYEQFGFQRINESEMLPYFRKISRMANLFFKLTRRKEVLLVMLYQP